MLVEVAVARFIEPIGIGDPRLRRPLAIVGRRWRRRLDPRLKARGGAFTRRTGADRILLLSPSEADIGKTAEEAQRTAVVLLRRGPPRLHLALGDGRKIL